MGGNTGGNKARNQLRGGGSTNAAWLDNRKKKTRKRSKIAKASKRANRKRKK